MIHMILRALVLIVLVMTTGPVVGAETSAAPADPLTRQSAMSEQYELTFGLSYIPYGEEGLTVSEHGPALFTRVRHHVTAPLSLSYSVSPSSSITMTLTPSLAYSILGVSADSVRTRATETSSGVTGAIAIRHRLSPGHALDPTITLSLELPARATHLALSGSWLRDPVVLTGSLSYSHHGQTGSRRIGLNLGTGLFLNDKIRFKATAQQSTRIDDVALSRWGFSLGVVYALDTRGSRDVYVGLQRTEQGGAMATGWIVEWYQSFGGL